jgi:hypothetical protein
MTYFTCDEDEAGEANYLPACITGCEPEPEERRVAEFVGMVNVDGESFAHYRNVAL